MAKLRCRGLWSCLPLVLGIVVLGAIESRADNWPSWRGPHLTGCADEGEYPVEWSTEKNVVWTAALPGHSGSTPVVWQNRIALTCPQEGKNAVLCFDSDGHELWQTTVGDERPGKHAKGSGTNPSPVTDGERIYAYFKSGDLAALDWQGNIIWQRNLQKDYGPDTLWWDLATSPVLTQKYVVVACMQTGPSYVAAFDKATGEPAWKVSRDLDAPSEAAQSYSTPTVVTHGGQEQIIVLGADHVTCHAAETGEEVWRVGGLNPDQDGYFRSIASPVVMDDLVIAPYARGQTLTAIRLGGKGDVTDSRIAWSRSIESDVPTPAVRDGKIYLCSDKGTVSCLDAQTGKELWSQFLGKHRRTYSASPVLAGNDLYLLREDGTGFVVDVATQDVKATNSLGDETMTLATPVLTNDTLLLRAFDKLYCIRKPSGAAQQDSGNRVR